MSRRIELSDDQYDAFEHLAAARAQTPDELLAALIEELAVEDSGEDYEAIAWFEHLGASEEQIAIAAQIAETRSSGLYADA